ncbi:hypothetical protein HMI54_004080 [Coelomomyces lativittatus]|nr:hypothetical protein HMI54_004080 [Coelomomyces lativittatus]
MNRRRGHLRSNSTPDGKKNQKIGPSPTKTGGMVTLSNNHTTPIESTSDTNNTTATKIFASNVTSKSLPTSKFLNLKHSSSSVAPSTPSNTIHPLPTHSHSSLSTSPIAFNSTPPPPLQTGPRVITPFDPPHHRRSTSFTSATQHRSDGSYATHLPLDMVTSPIDNPSTSTPPLFYSPASSAPAQDWYHGGHLYVDATVIRDAYGRTVQLRGVNLCGDSKLPSSIHSDNPERPEFFNTQHCSFLNRPFPLKDAPEHFSRLSHWGLTFVRLLVPWEALEHEGPGIYDESYIDYLVKLCELMPEFGVKCFIDPHQDVWSRFSGGSGAPGWTLEAVGLDIRKFKVTGAAHIHDVHLAGQCDCAIDPVTGVYLPKQDPLSIQRSLSGQPPPMLWPTNYTKLASSTMFTLFFAGETLAPSRMVGSQNIQTYLQTHYINAYKHLASRLRHIEAVIGFEVMNEPHQGYVGLRDLTKYDPVETLMLGDSPSALQSFCLGEGIPQLVEVWAKSWPIPSRKKSIRVLNAERQRVWLPGYECPWKNEGVYRLDQDTSYLMKPSYFTQHPKTQERLDFNQDFYLPFVMRYAAAIQQVFSRAMVFMEPVPLEPPPMFHEYIKNLIFAPHWYDLDSVFKKTFSGYITHDVSALRISKNILKATYFGMRGAKKNYRNQLLRIKRTGMDRVGLVPMVVGECGIPMDLNRRAAFDTGDYMHHNNFLDAVISAMESNLVHFTLWNYNPGNDHAHGDKWNGEDFSIFSPHPFHQYSLKSEQKRENKIKNTIKRWSKELSHHFTKTKKPWNTSPISPITPFDITELYFSEDVKHHAGGRVLDAVIRPYATRIAGTPTHMSFDLKTLTFRLEFKSHHQKLLDGDFPFESKYRMLTGELPPQSYETVVYVPKYHYGYESIQIQVSDGVWSYYKHHQTLFWRIAPSSLDSLHTLEISVKQPKSVPFIYRMMKSISKWMFLIVPILAICVYLFFYNICHEGP